MPQRLPSLNALRTFEAVARHLSLTKAARELCVTPAAVSHQIRALEAELGIGLLQRRKGTYVLSREAQSALPVLQAAFSQFAEAVRRLRAKTSKSVLRVNVCPTFAANWLVPRLGKFRDLRRDIDVDLNATENLADFDGVDIAIRLGAGNYPELKAFKLFEGEIFPACSPRLLESGPALDTPADILNHTLLHVDWSWLYEQTRTRTDVTQGWANWLRAAGVESAEVDRGPRFSHISLALRAAVHGQGIALVSELLARDELANGHLVRLFETALPRGCTYYIVYPHEASRNPKVATFRDWILTEVGIRKPGLTVESRTGLGVHPSP